MRAKTLAYTGMDFWGRPVYKDENGMYWKDVEDIGHKHGVQRSSNLHSCIWNEPDGEPLSPMGDHVTLTFVEATVNTFKEAVLTELFV